MVEMVPKEGAEIKCHSVSRYIKHTCRQFQTICTMGGKGAKLVIDPRSHENIVSEEATHKLGLEIKRHPTPYQLEWFTEGNECDVVDMETCHLLLGKPWKYDKATRIVLEEAARKLELETKRHPTPYQLEWFTKGNKIDIAT